MHLRSLPTMERISVPVRRHPEHYFVVQRSVRLIAIILYQGYNTLKQGLFHIKAVTALLRESHTLNKAVTAVFTSKAAARYKAVIVLRHTTALLRDPYCINNHIVGVVHKNHIMRMRLMYHAAYKVEFQPFKRLYSQLTFFNFLF